MIRLLLIVLVCAWGAWQGGFAGFFACFLFCGLLGFILGPPGSPSEAVRGPHRSRGLPDDGDYVPARRGQKVDYSGSHRDPTRPSHEDYAAMIADNWLRRRWEKIS